MCRKRHKALLGGVIGVVQLIVNGFSLLRMMAAGDLGGRLAIVVPAVEIGELLAIIFLVFFGVVVVGSDDVLGRLGLRSLRFRGSSSTREIQGDFIYFPPLLV